MSGIPCVHAISCLNFLNADPLNFVYSYYKVETYVKTYANLILPINGKEMWHTVDKPKLFPPDVVSRPGRPKKARRREPEEPDPTILSKRGVKMSCCGCGREGHNKRGCRHKDEWDAYAAALVADKIASAEKRNAKKMLRTKENAAKKIASAEQNAARRSEKAAIGGTTLIDDPKHQLVTAIGFLHY